MLRRILSTLILVVINAATAQTSMIANPNVTKCQSDKGAENSEIQIHDDQRLSDLRIEHADVPVYPDLARTARIFGTVRVEVTVENGKVISTKIKSGPQILASATVNNILTWRFHPLVNATFTTKFIYHLETNEIVNPQNPKVELQLPLLVKITAVPVHLDQKQQK